MSGLFFSFGILLPWVIVAFGCWIGYQLLRQNGRILLQLEALELQLARLGAGRAPSPSQIAGLPVGTEAPEFELPSLSGGRQALADFRGRPVLLIFFNPRCGFCKEMAADMAALPVDGAEGRPLPLLVTTGDPEENRLLVEEHGIRCPVLLQDGMEVASRYQARGTPMGYLIDAEGKIAGEIAAGAPALLELADSASRAAREGIANGKGPRRHRGNRPLAESRIQRQGLAAGTPAPGFTLPCLDGRELSLDDYRGRKVLLVFSDPNCRPCAALLPELEEARHRTEGVELLMISRGDLEANRRKAAEQGITFPVLLQRQWEISRRYAMFATPIAYLIDEQGSIATEVAQGPQAILELFARAASRPSAGKRCKCGKPLGACGCGASAMKGAGDGTSVR
jgi:peroxiredoxin